MSAQGLLSSSNPFTLPRINSCSAWKVKTDATQFTSFLYTVRSVRIRSDQIALVCGFSSLAKRVFDTAQLGREHLP